MKRLFCGVGLLAVASMVASCGSGTGTKGGDTKSADADTVGWISLFDGKTFTGWRGYNKDRIPTAWTIEDGAIKINASGAGEAGAKDGGDLIFDEKFGNFELELE